MNNLKRSKIMTRILTPIFAVVMVFSCVLTASAYEPAQTLATDDESITGYISPASSDFYVFGSNEATIIDPNLESAHFDFSESDTLIIDEDGNVTPYFPSNIESHVLCDHGYAPCTVVQHTKNSSGGCKSTYFKGRRYQICGWIVLEEYVKTITYKICPH